MYLEPETPEAQVRALIKSLHPRKIEKELVRLGPEKDGGYLVPNDLDGITACFSPGVGRMSEFEVDCLERNMKLYLADKSVDGPGTAHKDLHFIKKFVGCTNNDDFMTMDQWVADTIGTNSDDMMLQMDIEGYEYMTLLNISDKLLHQFRVIVIEFHSLHKLWNREFFKIANASFEKLLQNHYCVHIHPNNITKPIVHHGIEVPIAAEFTFIRKDRVQKADYATQFPHKLDRDNTPNPSVVLPADWYAANRG
ncbi:MAG: hypothetical protein ACJARZ_002765 [Dokdonia sp.]